MKPSMKVTGFVFTGIIYIIAIMILMLFYLFCILICIFETPDDSLILPSQPSIFPLPSQYWVSNLGPCTCQKKILLLTHTHSLSTVTLKNICSGLKMQLNWQNTYLAFMKPWVLSQNGVHSAGVMMARACFSTCNSSI